MYVKWSQDKCTRDNVSKIERKEKIQKSSLHPSYTLPLSQKDSVRGHGCMKKRRWMKRRKQEELLSLSVVASVEAKPHFI